MENTGRSNPQPEASEGANAADAFIADFQPPELWDNTFLLLKARHRSYFVMAA